MSAHSPPAATAGPATIFVHATGAPLPDWVPRARAQPLDGEQLDAADARAALADAECVLLDATHGRFVQLARRIHSLEPAVQCIAVTPQEQLQHTRRALLYAPGLGEIWVASPGEVSAALAERAAGVTRQRRRFARARVRIEREGVTTSPQRTERALISDAYLAGLLRLLPDPVFSVDAAGRVLSTNAAAESAFSGGVRPLAGERLAHVLGLATPAADPIALLRAAVAAPQEVEFRRSNGETGTGELRAAELDVGGASAWAVVLRDVTEARELRERLEDTAAELEASNEELQMASEQLEVRTYDAENAVAALRESEATYRALADAIPTLAWTARPDGYIDWYNRRWYEYTGTTREEMEGWGWQRVHDPAVVDEVLARFRASLETGEPFEMTFPLRAADGTFRSFLTRMVPLRDDAGRVLRWFGTNTDVESERAARAEAEAANRAKSQFLATMSHELRTPLNAITGHVGLILENIYGPVTPEQRTALDRVLRAQQHLLGLINDVLSFARLESGRIEYHVEPLDPGDVIANVLPMVEPQLASKEIAFRVELPEARGEEPLRVLADEDKLVQILVNLVSNAIKFTDTGGTVTIRLERHAEHALIHVADTGIGIPADSLGAIFEPFIQVEGDLTRTRQGSGLGLAISRDLARGMHGDLDVISELGHGSTFTLRLRAVP